MTKDNPSNPRQHTMVLEDLRAERIAALNLMEDAISARQEAEAANRAKDKFLAMLSHELRTPLTPVLMAAESLLRLGDLSPRMRDALQMICRNVEVEIRLIDDLLDLTRIAHGKMEFAQAIVDVKEVVSAAANVCRRDFELRNQTLLSHIDATESHLLGDATRLQQVFWNLLKNACKFTPEAGQISLTLRNEDEFIVLILSDNGCGFAPDVRDKIFEPFEQSKESVVQDNPGLGLGLAISKAIVEAHRGTISAQSDGAGKGATFQIRLPRLSRNP